MLLWVKYRVVVDAADYLDVAMQLRDAPGCQFEQLIDLCGVDYSEYKEGAYEGPRYCVVSHLLSVTLNQRVRLKVFAQRRRHANCCIPV